MCGFVVVWKPDCREPAGLRATVELMRDEIKHRGPDDSGVWADDGAGIAMGFRRLAILDISPAGHQPMVSASGRFIIVFNGEVYNFEDLRRELESAGHTFHGHSDTEVILAGFEQWGVSRAVERFVGMFAIALWDRSERKLYLIRDRLGIKPLYYGWAGKTFLCGSELKTLCAYPGFERRIDRGALALYLRHLYVPAPYSIYEGTFKLPPGCILEVNYDDLGRSGRPKPYWSTESAIANSLGHPVCGSEDELADQLEAVISQAVRMRMVADVPLGAFLSGGVDSSLVVALMQANSSQPIKTFTIGFNETGFDEARHAKEVARALGTDHTEVYLTPEETRAVIPRLPEIFDEPFADSSQIPTLLVSEIARRRVTVSLSGDGGDELFGGYQRFLKNSTRWRMWGWLPHGCRQAVGRGMLAASGKISFDTGNRGLGRLGYKLSLEARLLSEKTRGAMYREYISINDPKQVATCWREPQYILAEPVRSSLFPSFYEQMMYMDTVSYLPDDILTKVDRASMAVSLEARVPLLDHRILEFAWRLPFSTKLRDGQTKWILKQVLYRHLPKEIVERPKMGFAIPLDAWMRGPLREWAESLLNYKKINQDGLLNAGVVRSCWEAFLKGNSLLHPGLWGILMFEAWKERWL